MAKKRKHGTGTVRKRTDGRWEARIITGYNEEGKPVTKSALAKSKKECLEKLEELKEKHIIPVKNLKPSMPFGQWVDFWYQNYVKQKIRATTRCGYETCIYQHVIPGIGKIPLNELTKNDLQKFYSYEKKNGRLIRVEQFGTELSNAMVRQIHAKCRAALEKAVDEGFIRVNPAIGCKLPPKKSREMNVLSPEEVQRFLIQAKEEGYYDLFLLELATGMRAGELLGLQWKDINFQTGELKIRRQATKAGTEQIISVPKTKSSIRSVILPQKLIHVLKDRKKTIKSMWVFPSERNENDMPMTPGAVNKVLKRTLARANCKEVRFHDLRHTFATTALEHGMDIKTLSAILGHISAATTLDIYSHVTDKMQEQAAARIDGIVPGNETPDPSEENKKPVNQVDFVPYKPYRRRRGQGMVHQIGDYLWEGRYSPRDAYGKRISKNVYAHTKEECEEKLEKLIPKMKAEIEKQKMELAAQQEEQDAGGMTMKMA